MSKQYPGGLITKNPVVPSGAYQTSSASGIWTLEEAAYWKGLGQWPTAGVLPSEPYFNYVNLLLHGNGNNGAQNNTFLDSSANNFTISRSGSIPQGTWSPFGPNWSNYFDGSGDYFQVSSTPFDFSGGADFTLEFFMYIPANVSYGFIYQNYSTSPGITGQAINAGSTFVGFENWNGGDQSPTFSLGGTTISNQWNHIAMVRSGSGTNNMSFYINGVRVQQGTLTSFTAPAQGSTNIGARNYLGYKNYLTGYISNLRIVKGTGAALYSGATITVPTAALTAVPNTVLLMCGTNRFADASSNNYSVTKTGDITVQRFSPFAPPDAYSPSVVGGSGYFSGATTYLSAPSSTAFDLGTGDFTIECWFYRTTSAGGATVVSNSSVSNGNNNYFVLAVSNTGAGYFEIRTDGGSTNFLGSISPGLNCWVHLAVTRQSGTVRMFTNGALAGSQTNTNNIIQRGVLVGAFLYPGYSEYFPGYISNARILKGTALYTSAFTPPTTPLTAITNTSLLCNMTNAGIFDNAMMNDLETVGNAQISTSVKKYGTGSMAFDGSGDYLQMPLNNTFNFGASSFTIEMWVNPSTTNHQSACLFTQEHIAASNTPISICIYLNGGNYEAVGNGLGWGIYSGGAWQVSQFSLATIPINTWTFIALVRNGNVFTMYVNGTSVGSVTYSGSCSVGSTQYFIGRRWDTYGSYPYFNGYIDDFRLTLGVARYTANFTPPTSQFLDQ